jgi:hypothetical protein
MLKLMVGSKNQWKDELLCEWDPEALLSLQHLSSCCGDAFESLGS